MRRTLIPLALAALLVTAGCAGVMENGGAAGAAPADAGERTVTVGANGQVQTQPNQAVVRLEVVATGDDVETARGRLAENTSSMRAALVEAGLEESRITTERYDIRQERVDPRAERTGEVETTYRASHAFSVLLSDLDRVGSVIDTAVANGANNVDGVRFTLSEERRGELRREALANAMDNARAEADVIAEGANLTITGVGSASTVHSGYTPYYAETVAFASGDAGGTSVSGGPVTVSTQVTVTYNATA
jgi:uncharacterized protein YggE